MTIVYVVRTFPKLSESFVLREVRELVRRGVPLTVWSLRPDAEDVALADAASVLPVVRQVPGGAAGALTLALATVRVAVRTPVRFARTAGWGLRWTMRERDARHAAAVPFAAFLALRLPADAHVHSHFANAPTTVAQMAADLAGRPASFTGHARDIFTVTSPAFLAEKISRATFVAVGTEFAARRLRALVPPPTAERIVVVRTGLEAEDADPAERSPVRGRIVAVGRLVPKKGLPTLLEACALLRQRGEEVTCTIVGDGPDRGDLERLADRLGLAGVVTFAGALGRAGVASALREAEVFALPCQEVAGGDSDASPLAILEAMQAGAPVVTTPVGGITEMVEDGRSGLLVPPSAPEALADALSRVLGDPGLATTLQAGGRAVLDRFDVRKSVDTLLEGFASRDDGR